MNSTTPSDRMDSQIWKVIPVVMLAPLMTQIDSTVINVSLSSITDGLHSTVAFAQWTISGYLLALALMLPMNGWLVDRVGAKRIYMMCFAAFTLASLLCGASRTMNELIGARLLQGIAGGLLAPLTQLMMARMAGPHLVKVLGYAAAPVLLAPLFGPILAGAILKYAAWPWLFYINLPVGILAIFLAIRFIPHDEALLQKRPFDWKGFLLISPGLVSLIYGFERTSHRHGEGAWFLGLGALLLAGFILYARRRGSAALIDLGLFKVSTFSAAASTQFLSNGIMYAGQFLIPLYLISGCGLEAVKAGSILAAMGIGMLAVYPLMSSLTEKFGYRAVAVGGVFLNFLGTLPFLWMALHEPSIPLAVMSLFVRGIGQGSTGIPSIAAAYASVPKERLSAATTAMNIVQRLGGPLLTTAIAVSVSLSGAGSTPVDAKSFVLPFVALIAFQFLVIISASRLPVRVGTPSQ